MNILRGSFLKKGKGWQFQDAVGPANPGSFCLEFATHLPKGLDALPVDEVHLGFRPEAVHLKGAEGDGYFDAQVDLVENSGAESTLYLRTSQHRLGVRIPQIWEKSWEGKTCRFYLNPRDLYFFDIKTGECSGKA